MRVFEDDAFEGANSLRNYSFPPATIAGGDDDEEAACWLLALLPTSVQTSRNAERKGSSTTSSPSPSSNRTVSTAPLQCDDATKAAGKRTKRALGRLKSSPCAQRVGMTGVRNHKPCV